MQLISVERWTFWSGLAVAFFGPLVTVVILPMFGIDAGTFTTDWLPVVLILMIVSVAIGGSRDPSIRRVPAQPVS